MISDGSNFIRRFYHLIELILYLLLNYSKIILFIDIINIAIVFVIVVAVIFVFLPCASF